MDVWKLIYFSRETLTTIENITICIVTYNMDNNN